MFTEFASAVLAVEGQPTTVNTTGILSFVATKIVPLLIAIIGVVIIGRATKGSMSSVLTTSAIAIIGLVFLAGATTLFFLGDVLVKILFA